MAFVNSISRSKEKKEDLILFYEEQLIEEHCEHPHQVELFMMALVLTTLSSYEIDIEKFADDVTNTHRNALTSIKAVKKLLSKFMKGDLK